jgi:hypothetical protein
MKNVIAWIVHYAQGGAVCGLYRKALKGIRRCGSFFALHIFHITIILPVL